MRFFWGGHFEFFKSAILNFFLLHISEKPSPFIWGIIFFCIMDGFPESWKRRAADFYAHHCIWLGMYNFGCGFKIIALHASQEVIPSPRVQKLFSKTAWFQLAHQRGENWGQVPCYKVERAAFKRLLNSFVAVGRFREVSQLGHKGFEVAFEYLNSHGQLYSYIIPTMKTVLSVL